MARPRLTAAALALGVAWVGCAGPAPAVDSAPARRFDFAVDTIAYGNDLVWDYAPDGNGGLAGHGRDVDPDYARYCFVVARTVAQFFAHARFAPDEPRPDEATLRSRIREVVGSSPSRRRDAWERVVIPGYASLRALSAEHEEILKAESGGWWQSYLQRGNWRMILPFPRWHQAREAERLVEALEAGEAPIVHLVRFPRISINHAVVLYDYEESAAGIRFLTYDPNQPDAPTTLRFDRAGRTFHFPRTHYFVGGRADVYRIYRGWFY